MFFSQCKAEYKVPGLYVIDSIVRQSRHQFGTEKDVFAPRFSKNIITTFQHLYRCPPDDKVRRFFIVFRLFSFVALPFLWFVVMWLNFMLHVKLEFKKQVSAVYLIPIQFVWFNFKMEQTLKDRKYNPVLFELKLYSLCCYVAVIYLFFQSKIVRVLNLWQKNAVFKSDIIQPLLDMAAGIPPPSTTPVLPSSTAPINNTTPGK